MSRAILLSGPVGSGKTSVLRELDALLGERGTTFALVDLDWLCWAHTATETPVHELLAANLAAVWRTYRAAGVERLVAARALTTPEDVEAIRQALGDTELTIVELCVPRDELVRRVRARDSGEELEEHLALLARGQPRAAAATVDATGPPAEVAREVLAAAGW